MVSVPAIKNPVPAASVAPATKGSAVESPQQPTFAACLQNANDAASSESAANVKAGVADSQAPAVAVDEKALDDALKNAPKGDVDAALASGKRKVQAQPKMAVKDAEAVAHVKCSTEKYAAAKTLSSAVVHAGVSERLAPHAGAAESQVPRAGASESLAPQAAPIAPSIPSKTGGAKETMEADGVKAATSRTPEGGITSAPAVSASQVEKCAPVAADAGAAASVAKVSDISDPPKQEGLTTRGAPSEANVLPAMVAIGAVPAMAVASKEVVAAASPVSGHATVSHAASPGARAIEIGAMESTAPNRLEIGVRGGTLGWLNVRAEVSAEGSVHASLRGSATATAALSSQLDDLRQHLNEHAVAVEQVTVVTAKVAPVAAPESHGFGSAQQDAASSHQQGRQQQGGVVAKPSREVEQEMVSVPLGAPVQSGSGVANTGGWLSVRA